MKIRLHFPYPKSQPQMADINKSAPISELTKSERTGSTLPEENEITKEQVENTVRKLNQAVALFNKQLSFVIHEKTEKMMVQIIDKETKEVIKEIPPREILDLEARIKEYLGWLLDERI
jgi:flagellar protein FlaG